MSEERQLNIDRLEDAFLNIKSKINFLLSEYPYEEEKLIKLEEDIEPVTELFEVIEARKSAITNGRKEEEKFLIGQEEKLVEEIGHMVSFYLDERRLAISPFNTQTMETDLENILTPVSDWQTY